MTSADKRLDDLKSAARAKGIAWRQPGTSHVTFRRADGAKLTVPARKSIKPVYDVRRFCGEALMAKKARSRRGDVDAGAYAATVLPLPPLEGGGYLASAVELPGVATGETELEALEELRDAIRSWILTSREFGDQVPPPASRHRYSGKFVVRVPVSLHRSLALRAEIEGVSLNQLASSLLSAGALVPTIDRRRRKAA